MFTVPGSVASVLLFCAGLMAPVRAAAPPDYGVEWVTIGDPGNPAYDGKDPMGWMSGHGSVGYEYRTTRLETTTAQWLEFVNTFGVYDTPGNDDYDFGLPLWGAQKDFEYQGPGVQYKLREDLENPGMTPLYGMDWRTAAKYANWLHNGKVPEPWAIEDGVYDTSTFGDLPGFEFTDDMTPKPGAKYWIPTIDEWMKATFYDPDRHGEGKGGWWLYPNSKDTLPITGWPGEGETSSGIPTADAFWIELGAYPDQQSPWGLLDTSGGGAELTQGVGPDEVLADGPMLLGSYAHMNDSWMWFVEPVYGTLTNPGPGQGFFSSLRLASAVPAPSAPAVMIGLFVLINRRKR